MKVRFVGCKASGGWGGLGSVYEEVRLIIFMGCIFVRSNLKISAQYHLKLYNISLSLKNNFLQYLDVGHVVTFKPFKGFIKIGPAFL